MERLREMRAKSDIESLQHLLKEEQDSIREIFSNISNYHQDELTVGYIIYLHRRIVDMLNCLKESRKTNTTQADVHHDSGEPMEDQLSTLSIN